jgi:hypothetical protein
MRPARFNISPVNSALFSMPTNEYRFVDCWRVEGDVKEVADILDALALPRWWSSVYFCRETNRTGWRRRHRKVD